MKSANKPENEAVETQDDYKIESFNLANIYKISRDKESGVIGWLKCWDVEGDEGLHTLQGKVRMENDVLILSAWKNHSGVDATDENWKQHLKSLPTWNETKYFVKIVDFSEDTGLRYCRNGKDVDEEEARPIIQLLNEGK